MLSKLKFKTSQANIIKKLADEKLKLKNGPLGDVFEAQAKQLYKLAQYVDEGKNIPIKIWSDPEGKYAL